MELPVTVRGSAGRVDDVVVVFDPAHTVADLASALGEHLAEPVVQRHLVVGRPGRALRPDDVVAGCGLMPGDELRLAVSSVPPTHALDARPAATPARASRPTQLVVDVVAGPDSGRSAALRSGRWSLGRGVDSALRMGDPTVSRHHLDLEVGPDGQVTAHPMPGTANRVAVNCLEITAPTALSEHDVVELGATRIVVRPVDRPRPHTAPHDRVDFHRTPYRPPAVVERVGTPVGPIPARPEPRRLHLVTALAPLAAGLAMYAFTRQVQFLALTLISPLAMIVNSIEDRRAGRRTFADQLDTFRAELGEHRRRLEALRAAERIDRTRLAPDVADLVRRAEHRSVDLWARGRAAPDFLSLRVGLGRASVQFGVELMDGGDADLRAEARAAIDGLDRLDGVPITLDLSAAGVLAVAGEPSSVDRVATSLIVQAATLHSPDDLVVVAALGGHRPFAWSKWLPHVRSDASPLPGGHLAHDRLHADGLVRRLIDVAAFRGEHGARSGCGRVWPHLLVVLDADLAPAPAEVATLLALAPRVGMSVIWLASSAADVSHFATHTLDVRRRAGGAPDGLLVPTDPASPVLAVDVEQLCAAHAERAARALAPVRDAAASSAVASMPRVVPLFDVFGGDAPSAAWISRRWQRADDGHVRFPIGVGPDGAVMHLDLVDDGPHTLIGGTSGSGKSELLQSMVASLAAHHPPTRVNFLFVDYKGGASSQVFERLPHTVGVVTDLAPDLAQRALTSLHAELRRRMALLEGRAKDLAELHRVAPGEAPPSLVIVVDEFATLVKQVPEFVDGMIDLAQRGRSLGIHLVLATQRPTGSVNENILANANIRIALRMLDGAESTSILGSPEAAQIPVPLRGRALARLGPRRLVEFQSAYGGVRATSAAARPPVLVRSFTGDDPPAVDRVPGPSDDDRDAGSQLAVVIDAVREADRAAAHPVARRPWCAPLPDVVTLDEVLGGCYGGTAELSAARQRAGRFVVVGVVDEPAQQRQRPGVIDLEAGGGLLVFGSAGSGATTLLRTIAASLDRCATPGAVATIGFDFAAHGLTAVRALPSVVGVATGDDLEAVTRHLTVLGTELDARRRLVSGGGGGAWPDLPRIVVLFDGFDGLADTLLESNGRSVGAPDAWSELVTRLVVDGRHVGIHAVVTAGRRGAVPARVQAAISNRLILRHADPAMYAEHGVAAATAARLDLTPGRGLLDGATTVQIATVSADPSGPSQSARLASRSSAVPGAGVDALAGSALPDHLALSDLPATTGGSLRVVVGVVDVSGAGAEIDLDWSHLTVSGPARSGRSTALAAVALSVPSPYEVIVLGPPSSPLNGLDADRSWFGRPADTTRSLERLALELGERGSIPTGSPSTVLVVDDLDELVDPALLAALDRVVADDSVRVVAAIGSRSMTGYTSSPLVGALRRARRQLLLQPDDPAEFLQVTGVRLAIRPGVRLPPGRGVLLTDRVPALVQLACPAGFGRRLGGIQSPSAANRS